MTPVPKGQTLLCNITRFKKGGFKNKFFPRFEMQMDDGTFLMGAKKRKKSASNGSNYLISRDSRAKKASPNVLGKVRSNFSGTEFVVFDKGANPKDKDARADEIRNELAAVTYVRNIQSNGPRQMKIVVPSNPEVQFQDGELMTRLNQEMGEGCITGYNKPPTYDGERRCFTMNFNGRCKMASVKNFQLVPDDAPDHIMLQFCRAGKDLFNVDIRWPMSPMVALGICLTSLDSKIATD